MFPHLPNPLFAFVSFGSLLMGFWSLAAAAPIIIHLWNKRKYNEVTWAAMRYLLAAVRKNSRRIQIEQLILLIVRCLVLILFALALTDMACTRSSPIGATLGSRGRLHTLLVIDGSYSMGYKRTDRSRFEQAQKLAVALVEDARQGDGFTILLMADPPQTIIGTPAFDPADVIEEINSLKIRHGGADLPATLAEVQRIVQTTQKEHARLTQHKVCFLTDLGQNTWSDATTVETEKIVAELADRASLLLVDLGEDGAENLAVTGLRASEPFVTMSRNITFEADIKNFGSQNQTRRLIEFLVDDQRVHEEHVDVDAGGQSSVAFSHQFDLPGEHTIQLRLGEDHLEVDNHRWLSVPVRENIRVLCISGRLGSARYVAYALEPTKSDQPRVHARVARESAILEMDLNSYDCIILCNIGRFGRDEAGVLYDFLNAGGGLITFLGDQVVADSYNRELGSEAKARRVLPADVGEAVPTSQYWLEPREYAHRVIQPFKGNEQAGLLTTPVWKYCRLSAIDEERSKVALWFDKGDAAIIEEPILRGRSILVATAGSTVSMDRSTNPPTPWTALSSWHSFPPLVQEMLKLAISGRFQQRNIEVGQSLSASVSTLATDLSLNVIDPLGNNERVRFSIDGEESRWVFSNTDYSGVYQARFGAPISETQRYVANVDPRESDLERIDPEELPKQFSRETQAIDTEPSLAGMNARWPMFRYFLGGVLVLLFAETFLAWRFGNASA